MSIAEFSRPRVPLRQHQSDKAHRPVGANPQRHHAAPLRRRRQDPSRAVSPGDREGRPYKQCHTTRMDSSFFILHSSFPKTHRQVIVFRQIRGVKGNRAAQGGTQRLRRNTLLLATPPHGHSSLFTLHLNRGLRTRKSLRPFVAGSVRLRRHTVPIHPHGHSSFFTLNSSLKR